MNCIIFLDNGHRFKDDPEYGEMLKRMWFGDLTKRDRERINTRVIGSNGITLPSTFDGDACYACPTNKERNSISSGNFERHIKKTHPAVDSVHLPPKHTIIIEADIRSSLSKQSKTKINQVLRHRILTTCGDAMVEVGTRHIDPALCLYIGAYLICVISNQNLREKVPRGNGTLCRVVAVRLTNNPQSHTWKNYYNKKVWTVNAKDVEWIEVEHYPKSIIIQQLEKEIEKTTKTYSKLLLESKPLSRKQQRNKQRLTDKLNKLNTSLATENRKHRFKLKPQHYSAYVTVKPNQLARSTMKFACRMTQLPVNLNDATTGHKLQGMTKDVVIITSWPKGGLFKNWEYVVLSRVRTLKGLYLFQPIDMQKSFKPSEELKRFFKRARIKEQRFLQARQNRLAELKKRKTREKIWMTGLSVWISNFVVCIVSFNEDSYQSLGFS